MYDQRQILRASYWIGRNGERRLDTELTDPETGKPFAISERALDSAVFYANEMGDLRPFHDLERARRNRAMVVERHFIGLARDAINAIEAGEDWDKWLDRIKQKEVDQ